MVDTSDLNGLNPFDLLGVEAKRVSAFFESCDDAAWAKPTRCEGWSVRDLLSHCHGVEQYHLACLDDRVAAIFEDAAAKGATDVHSFNAIIVAEQSARDTQDVLEEWQLKNADVRAQLRDRGADGSMASSVGPYPVGLMAFHIASEYATHADDMDVAIDAADQDARRAWRAKVSLFALKETEKPVDVTIDGDSYTVRSGDQEITLSEHDFVEAVTGRLPADHSIAADLRTTLIALA